MPCEVTKPMATIAGVLLGIIGFAIFTVEAIHGLAPYVIAVWEYVSPSLSPLPTWLWGVALVVLGLVLIYWGEHP